MAIKKPVAGLRDQPRQPVERSMNGNTADIEPCHFPTLNEDPNPLPGRGSTTLSLRDALRLPSFCKQHRLSPIDALQITWAILLRRYVGHDSACFGRRLGDWEQRPHESNRAPDRVITCQTSFQETDTALDVARRMQADFQANVGSRLRSATTLLNSLPGYGPPPFDSMVAEDERPSVTGEDGTCLKISRDGARCFRPDAVVVYLEGPDHGAITLSYSRSRLSDRSAENVIHTLDRIFSSVIEEPYRLIRDIDPLSQRDWHTMLSWNLSVPTKIDACVHDLVEEHARAHPRSPAICSWDGSLSYAELEEASAKLAHHLGNLGVRPEAVVPVLFEKSMWAIVAMLAVLKAGGAFVPLDPSHPKHRLQGILQTTRADIILASRMHTGVLSDCCQRVVTVSSSLLRTLETGSALVKVHSGPADAAFILFTSGSTGKPKGIVQEHASVCTSSLAHGKTLGLDPKARVLQFAAYTFDVSMMDIFTTLVHGGCVCVPSDHEKMNDTVNVMNRMEVNWVLFTPSFANLVKPEDVPCLKTLVLGGEAMTQENLTRWADQVQLFNCYGPAECAATTINGPMSVDGPARRIGRAFGAGVGWVTDATDHRKLVPIGAVGELLVEGPTLARGYLNSPDKTAAAFIEDPPWLLQAMRPPGSRVYRTGDLVRYNADGSMDFIGRKDFQVKIRGQRVELGEIERHLSTHPAVASCVVLSPASGVYQQSLVGVVQPRSSSAELGTGSAELQVVQLPHATPPTIDTSELSRHLEQRLPPYMVPNFWIMVEALPLSTSAKFDRKLVETWLTKLENRLQLEGTSTIARVEQTALDVSAKVASLVGKSNQQLLDNIYGQDCLLSAIGMDSIQLISLSIFVKQKYGVKIGIEYLTQMGTSVRGVADHIDRLGAGAVIEEVESRPDLFLELRLLRAEFEQHRKGPPTQFQNVLITGSTGFLGTHILAKLFTRSDIGRVIAHVRASTPEHGVQRIAATAKVAGWWSDSFLSRLEVWTGDLTKPRIGLSEREWQRLTGVGPYDQIVNAIIHNGAAVHWNAGFETLKAANISSTFQLLKALSRSPSILKFIYISGGQQLDPDEDDEQEIAADLMMGSGYSQTKFVSELLLKQLAREDARMRCRISIVKPGYIIGTVREGVASVDDFIWRLVASSVDIKAYNRDEAQGWLFISDVDQVAATVSDCCNVDSHSTLIKILDGLTLQDFWDVLTQDLGYNVRPLDGEAWMQALQEDIKAKKEQHRLWPLVDTLDRGGGILGSAKVLRKTGGLGMLLRARAAIRSNIQHLTRIGFFPRPDGETVASVELSGLHFNRRTNGLISGCSTNSEKSTQRTP